MLPDNNHLYRFGDFILDTEEKVLKRDGQPVALTPKTFELLRVLVVGSGHIIEKKTLINEVWADSFVEESNLTFTIGQLRKTLGDNAQSPIYIETIARRGYRFIAEVGKVSADNKFFDVPDFPVDEPDSAFGKKTARKTHFITALAFIILLTCTIIGGSWLAINKDRQLDLNILSAPFSSEKISTNGKVYHAVITPDGKNVIYTNKTGGKQSIWLRELESSNNIEIIPASDDTYSGIAVSPSGNFIYFSRFEKGKPKTGGIYRASIYGGIPTKIVSDNQGWISISPDGTKISFVRCLKREDENCSLWIADSENGKNERKLTSRPNPFRIADNEFSPDGKTLAFAVGQSDNAANEFGLMEIDIETGAEREITKEKFFNIKGLTWLPDQSGLLITAARIQNRKFFIWHVSASSGEVETLTNDSQSYLYLSLDKTANILIATTFREDFRLRLMNMENPAKTKILGDASTAIFAPDGRIIFSSAMSGNEEIWIINTDGSGQKQLTNDTADDLKPIVSPIDNSIYFASNRTGAIQIWRMNADGSNQTQLTEEEGGYPILVTPDGQWIYFENASDKTLRRISKNGSEEKTIWNKYTYRFSVSPDGTKAAFAEKKGNGRVLKIISTADGKTIETFQPAIIEHKIPEMTWMPDGKSLLYILTDENWENYSLWLQHLDGLPPQKISDLGDDEISESSGFAVSPDGKSLIYIQGGWRHDAVLLKGMK